jgi:hypothetical protein
VSLAAVHRSNFKNRAYVLPAEYRPSPGCKPKRIHVAQQVLPGGDFRRFLGSGFDNALDFSWLIRFE